MALEKCYEIRYHSTESTSGDIHRTGNVGPDNDVQHGARLLMHTMG